MGLTEQLNPEKEALCIAVDKKIYVWAYDKPQHILTGEGKVKSIATKNNRLVFCDGWGIKDSLDKKISNEWPMDYIATDPSGRLFGTLDPAFSPMLGTHDQLIMDVESTEPVAQRPGDTKMLAGQPFLMDAGEYWHAPEVRDGSLYNTLTGKIAISGRLQADESFQGVAPTERQDELYVALDTMVERRKIGEIDPFSAQMFNAYLNEATGSKEDKEVIPVPELKPIFFLTSPIYETLKNMSELGVTAMLKLNAKQDISAEWEMFWKAFDRAKQYMPKKCGKFRYHKNKKALEMRTMPYKEAREYYAPLSDTIDKIAQQRGDFSEDEKPKKCDPADAAMRVGLHTIKEQCVNRYGITTMSGHHGNLAIGLSSGELILKDPTQPKSDPYVVWHFGKPITSVLTVPMEVYNDGLKQHVLKDIRRRAHFAGHGKMYKFDGIPQPLRKAV